MSKSPDETPEEKRHRKARNARRKERRRIADVYKRKCRMRSQPGWGWSLRALAKRIASDVSEDSKQVARALVATIRWKTVAKAVRRYRILSRPYAVNRIEARAIRGRNAKMIEEMNRMMNEWLAQPAANTGSWEFIEPQESGQ
jgi:hypothetical protein